MNYGFKEGKTEEADDEEAAIQNSTINFFIFSACYTNATAYCDCFCAKCTHYHWLKMNTHLPQEDNGLAIFFGMSSHGHFIEIMANPLSSRHFCDKVCSINIVLLTLASPWQGLIVGTIQINMVILVFYIPEGVFIRKSILLQFRKCDVLLQELHKADRQSA